MCSIILGLHGDGVSAAANRDEMVSRAWEPPAEYWPGICGGRDAVAGGTWLALNRFGVMAAVLNRKGTLGPAAGKESRGQLPLRALAHPSAAAAAAGIATLDGGAFRPFNLVLADAGGAWFIRGLGTGQLEVLPLAPGVHMITAGEPDDPADPRIARHLPRFQAAPFARWGELLADGTGERHEQINIKPSANDGFGTVCASLIRLSRGGVTEHMFASGPPDVAKFRRISWNVALSKSGADRTA